MFSKQGLESQTTGILILHHKLLGLTVPVRICKWGYNSTYLIETAVRIKQANSHKASWQGWTQ